MKATIGTAGKFTVYEDWTFSGPKGYIEQVDVEKVMRSAVLFANFSDAPAGQLMAVALQTDYAAWVGAQQFAGRLG